VQEISSLFHAADFLGRKIKSGMLTADMALSLANGQNHPVAAK
jgi:hypothetical protein